MSYKVVKPTEGEQEILFVRWKMGKATGRVYNETILKTKEADYTTTLKLMQIMFEKGWLPVMILKRHELQTKRDKR